MSYINDCELCLQKQIKIDDLKEEVKSLKIKLSKYERIEKDVFFGISTPSSKKPIKENKKTVSKLKGRKKDHIGVGRKSFDNSNEIIDIKEHYLENDRCLICGKKLENKGYIRRDIIETTSPKPKKSIHYLEKGYCLFCKKTITPKLLGVLPKNLYGNQVITNIIDLHYNTGMPIGRISDQLKIAEGTIVQILKRVSKIFEKTNNKLIEIYRNSKVKHADETGWRTNGKNGYTWLFATEEMSIFKFGKTRASIVPKNIFGENKVPGVLVVDRYAAYNKLPVNIQYCYAHLLRDVQNLENKFPDENEIKRFVAITAPLLSLAMNLRNQDINDKDFYKKAKKLRDKIIKIMDSPAKHLGIINIQNIFIKNKKRLYHWANDRNIPAENNRAERDLRPSIIARKVSFGSGSEDGAKTRSILTSIVSTLKKQKLDVNEQLKITLDQFSINPDIDVFSILFPSL